MKKAFSVIALLLALVMLVACGNTAAPAPSTDGTSEPAPTERGKTIVYWSMWDSTEPQGIVLAEACKAYEAATGNTVQVEFKGRTGIREGLQPALDAGTVIDLFDEDIDRINTTFGSYLMELEEFAKAADYEATANAGLISACRNAAGGKLMTIPYQPNVFAFFYNQTIFDTAGITAVPATWAEFLDACQKIKDAGFAPITCDDAYIDCMVGYHLARLGGEEAVVDIVTNGNWAENPIALKMAQDYEDLAKKGFFSANIGSNVWPNGQNGEFALGEVGMYLNGSWLPNEVKEIAGEDFKWGCFSYPAVENGVTGTEAANYGAQVFGINKNSTVGQEAFDLICYFTKGEYDAKLSADSLGIPADSANAEWPAALASVKPVMDGLTTRFTWAAGIESNPNVTPMIKENFTKLCAGTMTAQQFIDAMEAAGV